VVYVTDEHGNEIGRLRSLPQLKTTAGKTVLVLTTVNAGSVTPASLRASWTAFASIRPLIGNGTPKPWRLAPLADARAFVDDDCG
jgi:hypothetical protein